ncbi:MAG: hypothetical protein QXU47_03135 [Candidatus Bathyarchaeia archaeon]
MLEKGAYKHMKGCVERFFAWLKVGFRRLSMTHERLAATFIGLIDLACIAIHLKVLR